MSISTSQKERFGGFLGGANIMPIRAFTADATLSDFHYTNLVDATGGNVTITLPPAASFPGKFFIIKRQDASGNTVTIQPSGSDEIDTLATDTLAAGAALMIQSDGDATWLRLASF